MQTHIFRKRLKIPNRKALYEKILLLNILKNITNIFDKKLKSLESFPSNICPTRAELINFPG